jgi:hypothetical protein
LCFSPFLQAWPISMVTRSMTRQRNFHSR